MSRVEITETGFETLSMLARYMVSFVGEESALRLTDSLIDIAVERLSDRPLSCPVCHELDLIGVTDYQQLTVENYKILYRYDKPSDTAFITAFMRHRQSAQALLVSYALLR
ncbi:type II toxin-antitoxin system RelE/ParE family toxin [Marinobacterium sp. D7]|uniref:type II toxin-antitoxin system RelE/ParE family toxin n=1 Tax=Marinobacterium ramblicola TaxID=2849041 RepID=UPI001C2DB912|nr:type II toxin-antitoxin system RelE/ParE family toxin [Marinobacterium ramblicola]MBV1787113.1 type II toxin-antitoxin system RelE/ParE family toxin [Marinobacterium ramblicola]